MATRVLQWPVVQYVVASRLLQWPVTGGANVPVQASAVANCNVQSQVASGGRSEREVRSGE